MRFFKPANILILLFLCGGVAAATMMLSHKGPPVADTKNPVIHDFNFEKLNGETGHLYAYRNTKIVLHFWASWCAPCIEELPALFKRAKREKQIQFILITADRTPGEAISFLDKYSMSSNVVFGIDRNSELSRKLKVTGLPESFIFNPDYTVRRHLIGAAHWDNLDF